MFEAANMALSVLCEGETFDEYIYADERGFRNKDNKPQMSFLLESLVTVVGEEE